MSEAKAHPPPLRVLTLNAHQGLSALGRRGLLARIRDGLRATRADLVFLQEIGGDDEPVGAASQYEVLADRVWPQHAYGRNALADGVHQGNALLSMYPITAWRNIDVSVASAEPRGLLHCMLAVPGARHPLHAVCVHLGLREVQRERQIRSLLDLIGGATIPSDAPLVIAGDFNDWRGRTHQRLQRETALEEIHAHASGRPARTFPARWPLLRLDRIYVRNLHHRPLPLPRQPWAALSDHAPLAGEVRM